MSNVLDTLPSHLRLLDVKDAAAILNVSLRWLKAEISAQRFPSVAVGPQTIKVRLSDIEAHIEKNLRGAA